MGEWIGKVIYTVMHPLWHILFSQKVSSHEIKIQLDLVAKGIHFQNPRQWFYVWYTVFFSWEAGL